jgi:hypothetical protein
LFQTTWWRVSDAAGTNLPDVQGASEVVEASRGGRIYKFIPTLKAGRESFQIRSAVHDSGARHFEIPEESERRMVLGAAAQTR